MPHAGDGNCFYRALITAVLEDLCVSDDIAQCRRLRIVLMKLKNALKGWSEGITDAYYLRVRKGYYALEVSHRCLLSEYQEGSLWSWMLTTRASVRSMFALSPVIDAQF